MVANGTFANKIISLIDDVENMKTAAGIFLIFICLRVITLLTPWSERFDLLARTALQSMHII